LFDDVERSEPRGSRLWVRFRGKPIDCCFAANRFGINTARIYRSKPVGIYHTKSFGVDDAALLGGLGIESDRAIGKPADSKCEHSTIDAELQHSAINSKRQHAPIVAKRQPTVIVAELQPAQFVRFNQRERV